MINQLLEHVLKSDALVGALLGLFGATCVAIYRRVRRPDLVARAERLEFPLPPEIVSALRELYDVQDKQRRDGKHVLELTDETLRTLFESRTSSLQAVRGWKITVFNRSRKPIRGVKLEINRARKARFTRQGMEPTEQSGSVIALGDLRTRETVEVVAWTDGMFWAADNPIVLDHDEPGPGLVRIYEPLSPFWVWLSKWWAYAIVDLVVIFWMLHSLVGLIKYLSS